jgi:formimidoylglutamate deiminase
VLISAAEELRLLEYGQRLSRQGRNLLAVAPGASTGGSMWRAALRGGAQALGVTAELAPGQSADLISLDPAHPALAQRSGDSLIDGWIFAARDNPVDCVWRRGRKVVSGGHHHAREAAQRAYLALLPDLLG